MSNRLPVSILYGDMEQKTVSLGKLCTVIQLQLVISKLAVFKTVNPFSLDTIESNLQLTVSNSHFLNLTFSLLKSVGVCQILKERFHGIPECCGRVFSPTTY